MRDERDDERHAEGVGHAIEGTTSVPTLQYVQTHCTR